MGFLGPVLYSKWVLHSAVMGLRVSSRGAELSGYDADPDFDPPFKKKTGSGSRSKLR